MHVGVPLAVSLEPETTDGDAGLMLRVRQDDMEAFAELVRRYQRPVTALAYRYLGDEAEAEDLAQEVFLRVYRSRSRYEPRAKFSTWLYRIVVNASLNAIRARRSRPRAAPGGVADGDGRFGVPDVPDEDTPAPTEHLESEELAARVKEAVDALPENQRLAILMNKYEDLSYAEIAEAMNLSVMAVKSLLTRARVNVRNKIAPYVRDGRGA
jgi:RNA polymerase sigma-70 factor (ECF subfamily)